MIKLCGHRHEYRDALCTREVDKNGKHKHSNVLADTEHTYIDAMTIITILGSEASKAFYNSKVND